MKIFTCGQTSNTCFVLTPSKYLLLICPNTGLTINMSSAWAPHKTFIYLRSDIFPISWFKSVTECVIKLVYLSTRPSAKYSITACSPWIHIVTHCIPELTHTLFVIGKQCKILQWRGIWINIPKWLHKACHFICNVLSVTYP